MNSIPESEVRKSCNRWRFSLRTFLFVIVPFAAVTTWFAIAYARAETQAEAVRWVKQQGGRVSSVRGVVDGKDVSVCFLAPQFAGKQKSLTKGFVDLL